MGFDSAAVNFEQSYHMKGFIKWKSATLFSSMQSRLSAAFAWSNYQAAEGMPALLNDFSQGGASMKYLNAKDLLPEQLVEQLQQYVQGGYLYVPVK